MLRVRNCSDLPLAHRDSARAALASARNTAQTVPVRSPADSPLERILWPAVSSRCPDAVRQYRPLSHRRFLIDIAFPGLLLGIEADGWQYHGKHLAAHRQDRVRSNLLLEHGWRLLHYSARDIHQRLPDVLEQIDRVRGMLHSRLHAQHG